MVGIMHVIMEREESDMKVRDLNDGLRVINKKRLRITKRKMSDLLYDISGLIDEYEKGDGEDYKKGKDKIDVLKSMVCDMLNAEQQNTIIKGEV